MRIVPLSRCSKMLLLRMDDFGFGTDEISFHSALFLKRVRTPKAAPQYKLRAGSSPFPKVGGTGTMPWCSLSASATKTRTTRGLVCAEARLDTRTKRQATQKHWSASIDSPDFFIPFAGYWLFFGANCSRNLLKRSAL